MSCLVRRDDHARALNEAGLRVSGRHEFVGRVAAATDPGELEEPDLVLVCTKATGLEGAAATLAGHFPGATVMTTQNGLGAEEILRARGEWPIVSAVTFMSGTKHPTRTSSTSSTPRPGSGRTRTPLRDGRGDRRPPRPRRARVQALPDLRPAQWSKLIFNATVNGVAALTGLPHDFHFADPEHLGGLVEELMAEGKRVAAAAGVELRDDPWEMNVLATQRGSAHFPSMLEDVEAGRPTEVELINGALVREAERAGVDAPLQTALYALIRGRGEASYS